jgi:hypothetical protein
MNRSLRIVLYGPCLLALVWSAGCRMSTPKPLPDTSPAEDLVLIASPNPLVVRPGSSGRVRFVVHDSKGQPVAGHLMTYTLNPDPSGNGPSDARLSSSRSLTDDSGSSVIEILVGELPDPSVSATITLQASCEGADSSQTDILVTTNAYSVKVVPQLAEELAVSAVIARTRVTLFDQTLCRDLRLWNLPTPAQRSRSVVVEAGDAAVFSGVAGQGSSAVVGLGLDGNGTVQAGGCVDVPGSALLDAYAIRVRLSLDHLFPIPLGTYTVQFDFQPGPSGPFPTLNALESAWKEWKRCPLDPARLWLDCAIDALGSSQSDDPDDCVPVEGAEGDLGAILMQHRGISVADVNGEPSSEGATPCRGNSDASGRPSLESLVDALYKGSRVQLSGLNLDKLPTEIASLLGQVRADSTMTVSQGTDPNSYLIRHDLTGIRFPNAFDSVTGQPVQMSARELGLLVVSQTGVPATLKNGALDVTQHGFTLRLGTASQAAFATTSLRSRGSKDIATFVSTIANLAQTTDNGRLVTGCPAFDAVLTDQLGLQRGALLTPCEAGLHMLASKLSQGFLNIDGVALDYFLAGAAQVYDLDGDGRGDWLGQFADTTLPIDPAIWTGEIRSRLSPYPIFGQWLAWRDPSTP